MPEYLETGEGDVQVAEAMRGEVVEDNDELHSDGATTRSRIANAHLTAVRRAVRVTCRQSWFRT